MQENKTFRDTFLRVVALLGVILVLLLGAWGIILLAFNLSSIVGSVGSSITSLVAGQGDSGDTTGGEALVLDTPTAAIASGQSFTVSWEHTGMNGEYSYALSYSCQGGAVSLKAPTPAGKTQAVACNTPFNYTNADSQMSLTAANSGKQAADTTITVTATRLSDGAITATASADITINPAVAAAPTTPAAVGGNNGTYIAAPRVSQLYGYPDLSVRMISLNPAGSAYGLSTAQFEIVNAGTNTVPAGWNFEAQLPIDGSYQYNSLAQKALYPGDKIVYTLSFSGAYGYSYDNRNNYNNDSRYDECDERHNNWDEEDWQDWYEDEWDTSSRSRDDWDTNDWEDWYDDYCHDYDSSDRYGDRYGSRGGTVTITADPRNYVRELNEDNNTVSSRVY
jgi:hypothetical protein